MHRLTGAVRAHRFALTVAGAWLVLLWTLVAAGNMVYGEPFSLAAWAGSWDGAWYKSIVEQGYYTGVIDRQVNVAFFPLYPTLVWLVSKITLLPTVWAGIAVSSLSFAAALVVLWRFVHKFFDRRIARWTILLLAFNPWSLYFGMMYTESLFLLLAASTFWFIHKRQWWLAALMAGFATATRSVGIALAISVVVGWLWHCLGQARKSGVTSGLHIIPSGTNENSRGTAAFGAAPKNLFCISEKFLGADRLTGPLPLGAYHG